VQQHEKHIVAIPLLPKSVAASATAARVQAQHGMCCTVLCRCKSSWGR
jgi:hypothetical protein